MGLGVKKVISFLWGCLLVWLTLRWLLPTGFPFVLGAGLAMAAEPGVRFLTQRLKLPRPAASGIAVSGVFAVITLMIVLLLTLLFRELGVLAGILPDMEEMVRQSLNALQAWLLAASERMPDSLRPLMERSVTELFSGSSALLDRISRYILGLAGMLLSGLPDSALGLGTALLSSFMISAKLPQIRLWIRRSISRQRLRSALDTLGRMRRAALLWLVAQLKLTGITCILLTVGFLLLRVSYAPIWAVMVSAVDAFPILGTGTVLIPWSAVCLLQHDGGRALGLVGLYIVVALTRSTLEPKFVGKQLGMDPLVTLIALYTGFRLWGIAGMLLAPLLAVTTAKMLPEAPSGS